MGARALTMLFVEDTEEDVTLAVRRLQHDGLTVTWERVADAPALREPLARARWDVVVCAASPPSSNLLETLAVVRELSPHTSVIAMSSALREDLVDAIRAGVADVVTKDNLDRLGPAVLREIARPRTSETSPEVARMLLVSQELQARQIARAMHDRVGQLQIALVRALDDDRRDDARALAEQAIRATRELSTEVWPAILDDLGLVSALRWLAERYEGRIGQPVRLELADITRPPPPVEAACYRIAQEAFENIVRHAPGANTLVQLADHTDTICLAVHDDGPGFDPEVAWHDATLGNSLGVLAMRERASLAGGELLLQSAHGAGTTVCVRIPVKR